MYIPSRLRQYLSCLPCHLVVNFSLQGKANLLRTFVANYAEITKGFMRFLKKWVPFLWDDFVQCSFDALKKELIYVPLLSPTDYRRDVLLNLTAAESTIYMVLVKEHFL